MLFMMFRFAYTSLRLVEFFEFIYIRFVLFKTNEKSVIKEIKFYKLLI